MMLTDVAVVSLVGLLLSLYAGYVERAFKKNEAYKAACDLSDRVSCTRTFASPYATLFGISNAYLGILFYTGMLLLALGGYTTLAFIGAVGSIAASLLFAYILYFKIKTLCVVCTSIYVVNILLLFFTYQYL